MTSSPTSLPVELLEKLTKLSDISEHVRDISRKIADLKDDPLPGQLERSVPSYANLLTSHTAMLTRRHWMFVVAGDSEMTKAAFVDFLLRQPSDIDLRTVLAQCLARCPVAVCHGERAHYVVCLDALCDPVVLENWQAVEELIRTTSPSGLSWITVHLPLDMLKETLFYQLFPTRCRVSEWITPCVKIESAGDKARLLSIESEEDMDLVIYPDKIGDSSIARLMEVLTNSDVIIYVADTFNLDSTEKFQMFASEMRASRQLHQASFALTNCCMTVLLNNISQKRGSLVNETTVSLLNDTAITSDAETQSGGKPLDWAALLNAMNQTLNRSVESRLAYHFEWLNSYVGRVLYHLKAFLNQAEKSHDERLETYRNIIVRLTALTDRSEAFLQALETEVGAQYKEGVSLLRNHLLDDGVIQRLSSWTEDEAPDDELWQETDSLIRQRIQSRIRRELLLWERANRFFQTQRPRLIELFEIRFRGIKTHLMSVETMISHQGETSMSMQHVPDVELPDGINEAVESTLPFAGLRLNWTQKLVLGLAAPVLVPLAVAAALLGLPILGGLAARDLVVEKRSEVKSREYRVNKLRYLAAQTADDVRAFANSSALEDYVAGELRTAFHCIGQLREEVPQQIEAHRVQISALRDDDRQMNDLERFYRPLVEVFEHSRLLLVVFRLLHLHRERVDVKFAELSVEHHAPVICDSLTGTVTAASWTRRQPVPARGHAVAAATSIGSPANLSTRMTTWSVVLKRLTRRLDTRNIEDYLLEEEAYRFQACPYITRLLATSKHSGMIYHVLEPLRCSLRQHLVTSLDHNRPAAMSFASLRPLLIQLLLGLDYLHDRGWVHFDLTLDSVGVDVVGKVKLTNISCRQLVSVPDDSTASPVALESLLRYTHFPPEVLARPPAAYTPAGEMYSVGMLMYEMWTGQRGVHWRHLANGADPIVDNFEKLVELMRTVSPKADWIVSTTERTDGVNTRSSSDSERIDRVWADWTQRCWREEERVSCKALLQLVETESGLRVTDGGAVLPMNEQHYQEK